MVGATGVGAGPASVPFRGVELTLGNRWATSSPPTASASPINCERDARHGVYEGMTMTHTPNEQPSPHPARLITITPPEAPAEEERHVLSRFSLRGKSAELAAKAGDTVHVLRDLALSGQATVFYAPPNTGKTLVVLALLTEAIAQERVNPAHVIYLNLDDHLSGLVEKLRIAEEYGFEMLADGHEGFSASDMLKMVPPLVKDDTAKQTILIVDTLKKLTDLMDKRQATEFTKLARGFVLAGGTVIALAHTNKRKDQTGKSVYGGTSDIVDDLDCAYVIDELRIDVDRAEKVVEFRNIKRRGDVAPAAGFSYSIENGVSYSELLLSVRSVDLDRLETIRCAAAQESDADAIAAIEQAIVGGVNTKMELAKVVSARLNVSGKSVLRLIERYTGADPAHHRWNFVVRERGKHVFALLDRPGGHSPLA